MLLAPQVHALGGRVTAAAVAPNDFPALLRDGSEVGYVIPIPRRSLVPCIEAERLGTMAPWLVSDGADRGPMAHITPLVDTRLRAVVRRDWLALTMAWDSTVVVSRR